MSRNRFLTVGGAVVSLLLVGVAAGAQKLEVKSEIDPQANFTTIRTYTFLPPPPLVSNVAPDAAQNPDLSDKVLGPHIVAAIERQLAARGLTKGEPDTADVQIVYIAALTTGVNNTYLGEYYGYVTGYSSPVIGFTPSTSVDIHQKGTLVIDMVQRAAKRGIWHGSVVTRIAQERKLDDRVKRLNEAVERVFQKFPIRPKT
jgi:uncharacterized protein DUF4136